MFGAITGDIIGSRFEWDNHQSKEFELFSSESRFTDDTVLTIAIADGLMHGGDYVTYLRQYTKNYPGRGYGSRFLDWAKSAWDDGPYNSYGNGSAMRASAVGWLFDDLETVIAEARKTAEVTHNHPEGIKGAEATAAAILLARKGTDKDGIRAFISARFGYNLDRSIDAIREVYHFDESCQGTVPEAITAFLESDSFEDAIRNAISLGGDSDTLACITGSIAEAFYGGVPVELRNQVLARLPEGLADVLARFESHVRAKQWLAHPKGTEVVKTASLKQNTFQHAELSEALVEKIRNYKEILAEVEKTSLQETIDNFRRDAHPEMEVEIWQSIAAGYQDVTSKRAGMTLEQKREIYSGLLSGSLKVTPLRIVRRVPQRHVEMTSEKNRLAKEADPSPSDEILFPDRVQF